VAEGEQFADLVFEGGGVKGIGLAGAFAALEERGVTPKSVAGTSAGAITAALVAAGYTSKELDGVLLNVPFKQFKDKAWEDRLPGGDLVSLLKDLGIYEGQALEAWITGLLAAKGITKFGQLRNDNPQNPKHSYRLRVIASDVTQRCMLILPDDADKLGIEPDELEIARAVRMSMSIPVFFEPVIHKNPRTGEEHVIVDGGMLSNFPVWLFDSEGRDPRWPTFGLLLVEPDPKVSLAQRVAAEEHGIAAGTLFDYVKALASTVLEGHDRMYLEKATFARTIPIPTLGVRTTEFDITRDRIDALYQSGHKAADDFLDHWDFQAYIDAFRHGKDVAPRRDDLAA
jgi:NTE family protein